MRRSLAALLFVASPVAAQGFVQVVPVLPPVAAPAAVNKGYLQLTVTTQLEPLGQSGGDLRASIFKPMPALLALTAGVSTAGAELARYPVGVYDVAHRTDVGGIAVQVGRVQFLSLENAVAPSFIEFEARAVPGDLAEPFKKGLGVIATLAQNPAVAGFIPVSSQVTAATKLLTSFLGPTETEHPEWKSTRQLGLVRSNLQSIPLDGRVVYLFLRPVRSRVREPTYTQVEICRTVPDRLCLSGTDNQYSALPYALVSATILPFVDVTQMGAPQLGCGSSADDLDAYAEVVRKVSLTAEQRDIEERVVERYRFTRSVRNGALSKDSSAADLAFRWVRRDEGTGTNGLWASYGKPAASSADGCLTVAVNAQPMAESVRWRVYRDAFEAADAWESVTNASDGMYEDWLVRIGRPIAAYNTSGTARSVLLEAQGAIERRLLPKDRKLIAEAAASETPKQLQDIRSRMDQRRATTACGQCRDLLTFALAQLDARILPQEQAARAAVQTATAAASEKGELAAVQQEAIRVADVLKANPADSTSNALTATADSAKRVLSDPHVSADSVRSMAERVRQAITASRPASPDGKP